MSPKIRYVETSDEYRVRYVEYELFEGTQCFELLDSDPQQAKQKIAELRKHLKEGTYLNLSVKWGFCWAEYINNSGYMTHEPLRLDDFLPDTCRVFMPTLDRNLNGGMMREDHRLRKHIHHIHHVPEMQGTLKEIDIRFGPKAPKDYYGNYDYSEYPGGYSPTVAFYGEGDY